MKHVVKLLTFNFPWGLEQATEDFVTYYNTERYHEFLDNMTDYICRANPPLF